MVFIMDKEASPDCCEKVLLKGNNWMLSCGNVSMLGR